MTGRGRKRGGKISACEALEVQWGLLGKLGVVFMFIEGPALAQRSLEA